MASFAFNYLRSAVQNNIFQGTAFTPPTNIYVGLLTQAAVVSDTGSSIGSGTGTAGREPTSTLYSRVTVAASSGSWADSPAGVINNVSSVAWNNIVWSGVIVGCALFDAATNGNALVYGDLVQSKTLSVGDSFIFNASNLTIQLT